MATRNSSTSTPYPRSCPASPSPCSSRAKRALPQRTDLRSQQGPLDKPTRDRGAKGPVEHEKEIASGTRTLVVGPYPSQRQIARAGAGEGQENLRIPQAR